MCDADALAFWVRVETKALWRFGYALGVLCMLLHTDEEMRGWELVILADRALRWAEIHRCIAERPRGRLWYVKAGA